MPRGVGFPTPELWARRFTVWTGTCPQIERITPVVKRVIEEADGPKLKKLWRGGIDGEWGVEVTLEGVPPDSLKQRITEAVEREHGTARTITEILQKCPEGW